MRAIRTILFFLAVAAASLAEENRAPRNELAFGLGGLPSVTRSDSPNLTLGPRGRAASQLREARLRGRKGRPLRGD